MRAVDHGEMKGRGWHRQLPLLLMMTARVSWAYLPLFENRCTLLQAAAAAVTRRE